MLDRKADQKPNPLFEPEEMPDRVFAVPYPKEIVHLTGLEQLEAILHGTLPAPPSARALHQWICAVAEGRVEFRGQASPEFLNPMGMIHGGWTMAFLDSALGRAVHSTLKPGAVYASLGTEVKFIKPVPHSAGQLRAVAETLSRGRNTATAQARIEDRGGRLIATGTTTCFIRSLANG